MKNFITLLFLTTFYLFSCTYSYQTCETTKLGTKIYGFRRTYSSNSALIPQKLYVKRESEASEHDFTSNSVILYFRENKIIVDSILPYGKYKDVERLDQLSNLLDNWEDKGLCTVAFEDKRVTTNYSTDTFYLSDNQFFVGNLKKKEGFPDILILLNYMESWGQELYLISVDKQHNIIDMMPFCANGGDAGDFATTTLKYKDALHYQYTTTIGYQSYTEPIDTLRQAITTGILQIQADGRFKQEVIRKDSTLTFR